MKKIAREFEKSHRNGRVTKITDYSFDFEEKQKNGDVKKNTYYESYFLDL